jgi:hypothetical protein
MAIVARSTLKLVGYAGLLLLGLTVAGCKSRGGDEAGELRSSGQTAGASCIKPMVVSFRPAPGGFGLTQAPETNAPIKVQLTPKDLEKAESVSCQSSGACSAVFRKPMDFGFSVPMPMFARVKVDFQQTTDTEGGICMRKVKMGTSLDYRPACFGKLLNASIDIGVNMTQHSTASTPPTYDAQPYLRANLTYNSPFFSVGAHAGPGGLDFDSTVSLKGFTDNALLKEVLPEKTVSAHVDYKDLSAPMQSMRDALIAEAGMTSDNTDISWEAIDKRCDQSMF